LAPYFKFGFGPTQVRLAVKGKVDPSTDPNRDEEDDNKEEEVSVNTPGSNQDEKANVSTYVHTYMYIHNIICTYLIRTIRINKQLKSLILPYLSTVENLVCVILEFMASLVSSPV
jgi:hypothetical protein